MTLNATQCRELFEAVEKSGLDPRECDLNNSIRERWTRITHLPSSDHLSIARSSIEKSGYWIERNRSNSYLQFRMRAGLLMVRGWPDILTEITEWASQLAAVDIWREFTADRAISTGSPENIANTPFTTPEREEIRRRLRQIPAQVRERFDLTDEQESGIEQKMDELITASERVGKKDWLVMVYGAAFGLIVNDAIPAHVVHGIISLIITGLAHSFGIGGPPPFIPPAT